MPPPLLLVLQQEGGNLRNVGGGRTRKPVQTAATMTTKIRNVDTLEVKVMAVTMPVMRGGQVVRTDGPTDRKIFLCDEEPELMRKDFVFPEPF